MYSNEDFFATQESRETASTEMLTERLYSPHSPEFEVSADAMAGEENHLHVNSEMIEELKRLASLSHREEKASINTQEENAIHNRMHSLDAEETLGRSISAFQSKQSQLVNDYLDLFKKRSQTPNHCLYVLQGWNSDQMNPNLANCLAPQLLLTEQSRKTSGGLFFRWNGKGIVVNPGKNFLNNFHQQGLHIKDIDCIVVTGDDPDTYADIKEVYELNYQLNKVNSELQIINYYLSQKAFQVLSRSLKPNFKQERNTVHCLELFLDSPDVEKTDLTADIVLHYFPLSAQEAFFQSPVAKEERNPKTSSSLGIRFELKVAPNSESKHAQEKNTVRLAYTSGTGWSPLLAHHLGNCDILIAGFGSTNPNDYGKLKYNEDCLGYFGTYSLMEEVNPRLLLCSEFSGSEGDIRLEVVKKMRQDYAQGQHSVRHIPVVLPVDPKLFVNLKTLQIECSVTKTLVDPQHIRVVKSTDSFGNLHYLSPSCCT